MWNVKAKVIPVIVEATGTISKSLRQYLSNITGKHEIKTPQKTAILGTAHTHTHTAGITNVKVKVKESRCGPEGEVVSVPHRPPLPPGMFLVLIFTRG
jgi:hypothetical protein